MAHVRKDTLTAPTEWAKHLRRFGKKRMARRERRAAAVEIRSSRG